MGIFFAPTPLSYAFRVYNSGDGKQKYIILHKIWKYIDID